MGGGALRGFHGCRRCDRLPTGHHYCDRRIGLAIRYIAPHVRQATGVPDSAMLVRGEDRFGHFEAEPAPVSDMHPDAVALHKRITETRQGFIYRGTDKGAHRDRPEAAAGD